MTKSSLGPRGHLLTTCATALLCCSQHPGPRCPASPICSLGSAMAVCQVPSEAKMGLHTCLSGLSATKNVISSHQSWGQSGKSHSAAGPGSARSERTQPKGRFNRVWVQAAATATAEEARGTGRGSCLTLVPCGFTVSHRP